ncbi:MAG: YraN family protein [Proteobacteria bacterium]|nr:YraN family protein [Pseudomonadota bacterium]
MTLERKERGRRGEEAAASFLKKRGYQILEMNYRTRRGEIDIIALHKGVLAFVEVKTRTSAAFGSPKEAVGREKRRRISMAALEYLSRTRQTRSRARFDVVSVLDVEGGPEMELIPNAFELAYR